MIERFKTYIENEPWDEMLLIREPYLRAACWVLIIFAVIYFGPRCLGIILR